MRIIFIILFIGFFQGIYSQDLKFRLENINNENLGFEDVKGENITVFDFWATWCKPCLQLMPKLNDIAEEYSENNSISIIGVNIDDPRSLNKVKPFVNSIGIKYPILYDPDQDLATELSVNAIPSMVIVNATGEVLWFHEGYTFGDEELLKAKINELLTQK